MISNVPKDHHSLLQLYLDGPRDKLFYIFSYDDKKQEKVNIRKASSKINFLNRKSLNSIKFAQKNALIEVFKKKITSLLENLKSRKLMKRFWVSYFRTLF